MNSVFMPKLHLTNFHSQPTIFGWMELTPEEKELQCAYSLGLCVGCPFKLPLAGGLCCFIWGLVRPLAASWPSDYLLSHLARENNYPTQRLEQMLCPSLSWTGGRHIAYCPKFPIPDVSSGYCHGRHGQTSTAFFVMEPGYRLATLNPGLQAAPHVYSELAHNMEPVWHSWPKDTSGWWDQGTALAQTDMGAFRVGPRFSAVELGCWSLHVPAGWGLDCICYREKWPLLTQIWNKNKEEENVLNVGFGLSYVNVK